MRRDAAVESGRAGTSQPAVTAAAHHVAIAVLRLGLGLTLAAAATDWLFAAIAGAGSVAMLEGALLTGLAGAALVHVDYTARLLRPTGRVLIPVLLFAAVGALDFGLQTHYSEVAPAIVWIAVIVSATTWVAWCVVVSVAGYVADLALQGHSAAWMLAGPGQTLLANQTVDLLANAAVVLLLVAVLRRFVTSVPARLEAVRRGGPSLTAQLALAAGASPSLLLGRAHPVAVTATLSDAERRVLSLLADGRAPKQAARDLSVALPTTRSHISSAKRKTGARTLEQLVAFHVEADVRD